MANYGGFKWVLIPMKNYQFIKEVLLDMPTLINLLAVMILIDIGLIGASFTW